MNILISRCLLGFPCRYDGKVAVKESLFELIDSYKHIHNFIAICPEVEGGLQVPRLPCEIINSRVYNNEGIDLTSYFNKGALIACNKAKANNVSFAILKSKSPSCGIKNIYDGTFTHTLIPGMGVCARELTKLGVLVVNENDLDIINDVLEANI